VAINPNIGIVRRRFLSVETKNDTRLQKKINEFKYLGAEICTTKELLMQRGRIL
jgi:hypothetical protein